MKTRLLTVSLLILSVNLWAQGPKSTTANDNGKIAVNSYKEIRSVLDTLAKTNNVRIVYDKSVTGKVKPIDNGLNLEQSLDALAKNFRGLAWRKVYLKKNAIMPKTEDLGASVRAMISLQDAGIMIEDSAKNSSVFVKNAGASTTNVEFETTPIYVVINAKSTKFSNDMTPEEYADFQKKGMEAYMAMSPEDQAKAMRMNMDMWMNADPSMRQQMMTQGMKTWMNVMKSMTPEARQQMQQEAAAMYMKMQSEESGAGGK